MSFPCSSLPASTLPSISNENRRSANFHPSIWGDIFLSCPSKMNIGTETRQEYEELKQEIKRMLMVPTEDPSDKLHLIDTIKRLGVSYHFEKEVEDTLQHIYHHHDYNADQSLQDTSLRFRLLRENGFNVRSGLLQSYEASYLNVHGEHILEEALAFTTTHLKFAEGNGIQYPLSARVSHALNRPIRKSLPRWDTDCLDRLPTYMQFFYKALLDLYEEMEEVMIEQGKSYRVRYAKEAMKQLSQAYFVEAKWYNENYIPTIEKYMKNALVSSGYIMVTITSFVGMGDIITEDTFNWACSNPKIIIASTRIARLMDDIVSHKVAIVYSYFLLLHLI
ncbi:hypothetical protein V6N12_054521 [Hibiscus sabdariffa]|uniref:(+)-delta-cadinene synthase n=1 Tax=Hibiscus sabdariffa TaxID=183260 RepID=A0ABR2D0P3_9ROSI